MHNRFQNTLVAIAFGLAISGCGASETSKAFSPAEEKALLKEQMSAEIQRLVDIEKQFGMDHSQVQQAKMEMGLDPSKPAADQMPK